MRSERAFCERLDYDLLFKWFLDLPIDAKAFDQEWHHLRWAGRQEFDKDVTRLVLQHQRCR